MLVWSSLFTLLIYGDLILILITLDTVEGELGVAGFLVNYFSGVPFPGSCGCAPLSYCIPKVPLLSVIAERS